MSKKTRKYYPENWEEISLAVKNEAGWKCEECEERFLNNCNSKLVTIRGRQTRIMYGVHHKDRNPFNNKRENLIALCSPCHCRAELPLIRAEMRAEREINQMDLFQEANVNFPGVKKMVDKKKNLQNADGESRQVRRIRDD